MMIISIINMMIIKMMMLNMKVLNLMILYMIGLGAIQFKILHCDCQDQIE